jgi:dTDP-4-dehydrorhamnose 3,5-epimerase
MKIIEIGKLAIPEIKIIKYERFKDERGYFSETFRRSDFHNLPEVNFMHEIEFKQSNESFSKEGTVRGLHFQWNPYMGKMVRTVYGHMVDLILDIRIGSPTYGKIIAYDMPEEINNGFGVWIWIPKGFAHGNFFVKDTKIEYFCSGEYSKDCEAGISPLSEDLDWSLCDMKLKKMFKKIASKKLIISDKDRKGFSVKLWKTNENSRNFRYEKSK